jgi:hypothetical protein
MTIEQFLKMNRSQPFQPYRIQMANGRSLDVQHPEFVARCASGRTIAVSDSEGAFEIVDLLLVSSLEVLNGKRQISA